MSTAMQLEDIPEWVPEVVRVVAVGFAAENSYLQRFLTDPRMEGVWSYLMRQPVVESGLKQEDPHGNTLAVHGLPMRMVQPNEHACALLYWRIIMHTGRIIDGKIIALSVTELKEKAKHYKSVMEALPIISLPSPVTFGQPLDCKLLEAMQTVEDFCRKTHDLIMQDGNPYVITNNKSDENIKARQSWTQGTAVLMKVLWGNYHYGIVAKMMNVLFGLDDETITPRKVEGWCSDLPSGFSY